MVWVYGKLCFKVVVWWNFVVCFGLFYCGYVVGYWWYLVNYGVVSVFKCCGCGNYVVRFSVCWCVKRY